MQLELGRCLIQVRFCKENKMDENTLISHPQSVLQTGFGTALCQKGKIIVGKACDLTRSRSLVTSLMNGIMLEIGGKLDGRIFLVFCC